MLEMLALIEKDSEEYRISYEVGRRLFHANQKKSMEVDEREEKLILECCGKAAHQRLCERLRKVGL